MAEKDGEGGSRLARVPVDARAHVRVGARVLTLQLASKFRDILLSDASHNVESAALEAGLRPSTVRDSIRRYVHDQCTSLEDEEVCELVFRAKGEHVKRIRWWGSMHAGEGNKAAATWAQWMLETQDPLNHPRKQVEISAMAGAKAGEDGAEASASVRYVVSVPAEEPEEEDGP